MDDLKKLCSAAAESTGRCHRLQQSTHQLLEVLQSDVNPATVCRIIGSCFANSSTGAKVLQPELLERCSSSHWCHNLASSRECKSTSYCIQNVWSNQQYEDDDDSKCQVCRDTVQRARRTLPVINDSCKRIPNKAVSKECFLMNFLPEVTEMLVSQMTPTGICTVTGSCNSALIDNLLESRAAKESPDYCDNCTYALNAVQYFFRYTPRDQIQDKLLRVCNQLSSYSGACTNAVISNFGNIRKILTAELQPLPICRMCSRVIDASTTSVSPAEVLIGVLLVTVDANLSCDLCKQLVKHLKHVVAVETTQDEFQEVLKGVCQKANSFRGECLRLASESSPILYKFVTKELDSEEGCHQLALCIRNTAVTGVVGGVVPPVNETRVMPGVQWAIKHFGCSFWKTIIGVLQRDRNMAQFEYRIQWVLFDKCSTKPQRFQQECDFIHTEQVDPVIQILKTTEGFDSIALATTVCPDPAVQHKDLCPICEYALHFVQEELAKPAEQQRIEEAMNRTCDWVPRSVETECQTFIAEYGALMISLFSQKIDPSVVCPALRLCPRTVSLSERCTQCQEFLEDM